MTAPAAPPTAVARVAGLLFLVSFLCPTLNWFLVFAPVVGQGDVLAAAGQVLAHEARYRVGLAVELGFGASMIGLAVCLFVLLRPVSLALATLALGWRLAEAILVSASALVTLLALQVLKASLSLAAPGVQEAIAPFLAVRHAGSFVSIVFLGLSSVVFFALFFESRLIPRPLAAFGIVSYLLLVVAGLRDLLLPGPAAALRLDALQLVCFVPSIVAELATGAWLLVKGVDLRRRGAPALGSAPA